jgi:hypothetical protein
MIEEEGMARCDVVDCRKPVGRKGMSKLVKYLIGLSKPKRRKVLRELKFKPGVRKKVKQEVKKNL